MNNTINYTIRHQTPSSPPEILNFSFEPQRLKPTILTNITEIFSRAKKMFLYFTPANISKNRSIEKTKLSSPSIIKNKSKTLSMALGEEIAEEFNKTVGNQKLSSISYEASPEKQVPIDLARTLSLLVIHNNKQKIFDKTSASSAENVYKNIHQHIDSIFPNEKNKRDLILKRSDQGIFNSVFFEILSKKFTKLAQEIAPLYCDRNSYEPLEYYLAQSSKFKGSQLITHKINEDGSIINSGSVFIDLFVIEKGNKETIFSFEVAFACNLVTEEYDHITCNLLQSNFMI